MHKLYEQQRVLPEGSPEWLAIEDSMFAVAKTIPVPPGVEAVR